MPLFHKWGIVGFWQKRLCSSPSCNNGSVGFDCPRALAHVKLPGTDVERRPRAPTHVVLSAFIDRMDGERRDGSHSHVADLVLVLERTGRKCHIKVFELPF